jgi:leader peptidase (prepilin peptidase)/N-methyltransferase
VELRIALFVLAGAVLGFLADRLSARWPSHRPDADPAADGKLDADAALSADATLTADQAPAATATPTGEPASPVGTTPTPDGASTATSTPADLGTEPPRRGLDWRTPTMILVGAIAFGALAVRWTETRDVLILAPYFAALVVLMATDLDQRLLPDLVTLPMIPIVAILVVAGVDPLLAGKDLAIVSAVIAGLGAPALLILSSLVLKGGIGIGDLKLAISLGALSGISRLVVGFLIASAASSVILVALMATRRIGRRSLIPFGPVLIAAGMIAALLPG